MTKALPIFSPVGEAFNLLESLQGTIAATEIQLEASCVEFCWLFSLWYLPFRWLRLAFCFVLMSLVLGKSVI